MTVEYPEHCLKGIPNEDYFFGDSVIYPLFLPQENNINAEGWRESSVNWEIDGGAQLDLFSRRKADGSVHFRGGVARIPRAELDRIRIQFKVQDHFNYELKEEPGNRYHGNLLYSESLCHDSRKKCTICGAIARAVVALIRNET